MGIVKIVSGEPATKSGGACGGDDLTRVDRLLLQSFPGHESDDCDEQAEMDCELAMSRGQMCSIPYSLYDLPELTEVLSLETWNSCLTEDDRFNLAAYLPDMDQHDFSTTMKELLGGDAMFFGSPLKNFFLRLKSGLYSPKVSQARELLMIFHRRIHFHLLKLYHDGMVGKFASMNQPLISSGTSARPDNWASLPITSKGETDTFSPLKRTKLMDGALTTQRSTRHDQIVDRAKSVEVASLESQIVHPPNESREKISKQPKGVLKIRSGYACASIDGNERIQHTPRLTQGDQLGMLGSFCPPPLVFTQDAQGFSESSSSHINTTRSVLHSAQSSPGQCKGTLRTYSTMAKNPLGVQMTVPKELNAAYPSVLSRGFYQPAANHSLAYSREAYDNRALPHMKNLLKSFGRQSTMVHESSPHPYTRFGDGYQMDGYASSRNAESISEMSNIAKRIHPPHNNSSEQLETVGKYRDVRKPGKPITQVNKAQQVYYSRRKLHRSGGTVDSVKSSTTAEDSVSPRVLVGMPNMKAESIKLHSEARA